MNAKWFHFRFSIQSPLQKKTHPSILATLIIDENKECWNIFVASSMTFPNLWYNDAEMCWATVAGLGTQEQG